MDRYNNHAICINFEVDFSSTLSCVSVCFVVRCLLEQMAMKIKPIDEALRDFQILFRMPVSLRKRKGGRRKEWKRRLCTCVCVCACVCLTNLISYFPLSPHYREKLRK